MGSSNQKTSTSIIRMVVIGGGIVLIIAGMKGASNFVNMTLLAYIIVLLTAPIHQWLTKRRVPSFVSAVLIILAIVGLFVVVGWFIGLSLSQLQKDLPEYRAQLEQTAVGIQSWLSNKGLDISQITLPSSIPISSIAQPVISFAAKVVSGFSSGLSKVALILVIVFFALLESSGLPARMLRAFANDNEVIGKLQIMNDSLRKYIGLKAVTGLIMATADTLLLLVVGVEFAALWGLLAFLMNFIPNVGFIIALIPPVILAFLQFGLTEALIVLVGYVIINTVVNTLMVPRIMGQGLNLSAAVIFIALIFWSWVLGGVGIFMAVPLLIMVKVLTAQFDDTRWLAELISGDADD